MSASSELESHFAGLVLDTSVPEGQTRHGKQIQFLIELIILVTKSIWTKTRRW